MARWRQWRPCLEDAHIPHTAAVFTSQAARDRTCLAATRFLGDVPLYKQEMITHEKATTGKPYAHRRTSSTARTPAHRLAWLSGTHPAPRVSKGSLLAPASLLHDLGVVEVAAPGGRKRCLRQLGKNKNKKRRPGKAVAREQGVLSQDNQAGRRQPTAPSTPAEAWCWSPRLGAGSPRSGAGGARGSARPDAPCGAAHGRLPWALGDPARQISQLADSVAWYSSLMPVSAFLMASFDEAYSIFGLTEALSSDLHRQWAAAP